MTDTQVDTAEQQTYVVLFDKVLYTAKPAWQGGKPEQVCYRRGDEVDLGSFADSILGSQNELDRLVALGAVGDAATLRLQTMAATSAPGVPPGGTVAFSDAELSGKKVEELAAIVNQHPELAERIVRMEALKGAKARRGVLALHPDYAGSEYDDKPVEEVSAALVGEAEPVE